MLYILAVHSGLPQAPLGSDGGIHNLGLGVAVLLLHVIASMLQQGHHGCGEGGKGGGVIEHLGISLGLGLAPLPLSINSGLGLGLNWLQSTALDSDGLHRNKPIHKCR